MPSPTEIASFSIYTGPEGEERVSSNRRSVLLQPDALTQLQEDVAQQKYQPKKTDADAIYYFGTGPIVNPLVRKRCGIKVSDVRATILSEYRITFAVGGIANVVPGRGCEVHGVVMKFDSVEGWEEYQKMNAANDQVRPVDVYAYNDPDTPIRAYVFVMDGKEVSKDAPMEQPAEERYLKLIADGLKLHGVDEDYIEFTIMSNEYVPSRKPGDYHKFPSKSKKLAAITRNNYEALCRDAKDKYYFVLGDIVCEMPVSNPENPGAKYMFEQCHGKGDISWTIYKICVDPDIPEIESQDDLTPLHIEWAESIIYAYLNKSNLAATKCYRIVQSSTTAAGRSSANGGLLALLCCRGAASVQVADDERCDEACV